MKLSYNFSFPCTTNPFFACGSVQSNYNKLTQWRTPSEGPDLPAKGQLPRVRPVSSYRRRVSVTVWFYSCKNMHTKGEKWWTSWTERLVSHCTSYPSTTLLLHFCPPPSAQLSAHRCSLGFKHLKTTLRVYLKAVLRCSSRNGHSRTIVSQIVIRHDKFGPQNRFNHPKTPNSSKSASQWQTAAKIISPLTTLWRRKEKLFHTNTLECGSLCLKLDHEGVNGELTSP